MSAPVHATLDDACCRRFVRRYYLAHFWYDFIVAYAVYTLNFGPRGMSVLDISLLITRWAITAMAFEVPSGAFALREWSVEGGATWRS